MGNQKLEALSPVLHRIGHDINNTLSPIMGFSELLMEDPESLKDQEKTLGYLKMIFDSAKDAEKAVVRLQEAVKQFDALLKEIN